MDALEKYGISLQTSTAAADYVKLYTPNTSPPLTHEDFRLPPSYPNTDTTQEPSFDPNAIDLALADDLTPSEAPHEVPIGHGQPAAMPFAPYNPEYEVEYMTRQERIGQQLEALPVELDGLNQPLRASFLQTEQQRSTTPTTSPSAYFGIGAHLPNTTDTLSPFACDECPRHCNDARDLR